MTGKQLGNTRVAAWRQISCPQCQAQPLDRCRKLDRFKGWQPTTNPHRERVRQAWRIDQQARP